MGRKIRNMNNNVKAMHRTAQLAQNIRNARDERRERESKGESVPGPKENRVLQILDVPNLPEETMTNKVLRNYPPQPFKSSIPKIHFGPPPK